MISNSNQSDFELLNQIATDFNDATRILEAVRSQHRHRPRPTLNVEYEAPRTETEEILADIWSTQLNMECVGVHDDFFALGGHSLVGVQMASKIGSFFQIELSIDTVFDIRTIAEQAEAIEEILIAEIQAESDMLPEE